MRLDRLKEIVDLKVSNARSSGIDPSDVEVMLLIQQNYPLRVDMAGITDNLKIDKSKMDEEMDDCGDESCVVCGKTLGDYEVVRAYENSEDTVGTIVHVRCIPADMTTEKLNTVYILDGGSPSTGSPYGPRDAWNDYER